MAVIYTGGLMGMEAEVVETRLPPVPCLHGVDDPGSLIGYLRARLLSWSSGGVGSDLV